MGVIASISLDSRLHYSCRIEQQNDGFHTVYEKKEENMIL